MIKYNTIATSETFPWPSAAAELNWWQLQMDSTVVCVGMILLQSTLASRHDNAVDGHKLGNHLAPVVWNVKRNELFICLSNTTRCTSEIILEAFPGNSVCKHKTNSGREDLRLTSELQFAYIPWGVEWNRWRQNTAATYRSGRTGSAMLRLTWFILLWPPEPINCLWLRSTHQTMTT